MALTAALALTLGWGVPVARVGVTVCIITLVLYRENALEYDLLRGANTVIGIATGLAVSFFVWPVRARDTVARSAGLALAASAKVLDALAAGERDVRPAQLALYDALGALVKAGREAQLERRAKLDTGEPDARALQVLQFGLEVLAAALAAEGHAPGTPALDGLRRRAEDLAGTAS